MQDNGDPYEILQLHPSAEPEIIVAAYRQLALKYHPDHNKSPEATETMRRLNEAYQVLADPQRRRAYDAGRKVGADPLLHGVHQVADILGNLVTYRSRKWVTQYPDGWEVDTGIGPFEEDDIGAGQYSELVWFKPKEDIRLAGTFIVNISLAVQRYKGLTVPSTGLLARLRHQDAAEAWSNYVVKHLTPSRKGWPVVWDRAKVIVEHKKSGYRTGTPAYFAVFKYGYGVREKQIHVPWKGDGYIVSCKVGFGLEIGLDYMEPIPEVLVGSFTLRAR